MNRGGELETLLAVEVRFNAVRASSRRSIKMNANKNGIAIGVRDCDACAEREEHVAIACHDHTIAIRLQDGSETLGNVEIHHFLRNALSGDASAIESAVAGVDNDRR